MAGYSTSGTQIVPGMQNLYQDLLNRNTQNYQNILGGYSQAQTNVSQALGNIGQHYNALEGQVFNTLGLGGGGWGVAAPAAEAIRSTLEQQQGATQQQMISAGLGNTTVLGNMRGQNAYHASQAYGQLGAQLAQTAAGYQSQIGMANQAAQMQGLGLQTGLAQHYLGTLGGYHFANTAGNMLGGYSNSRQDNGPAGGGGGGAGSYMPSQALHQARQNAQGYFDQGNAFSSIGGYSGGGYGGYYGGGSSGAGVAGGEGTYNLPFNPETGYDQSGNDIGESYYDEGY